MSAVKAIVLNLYSDPAAAALTQSLVAPGRQNLLPMVVDSVYPGECVALGDFVALCSIRGMGLLDIPGLEFCWSW